jgi:hypothetical protein
MCGPCALELASEIRDLYRQQCELADKLEANYENNARRITESFRPREDESFPELARFKSVFDCQAALVRAQEDPRIQQLNRITKTANWLIVLAVGLAMLYSTNDTLLTTLAAVGVGGCLLVIENRVFFRTHLKRSIREQLADMGVPICIACGYDLRGQIEMRCPECGVPCPPPRAIPVKES